MMKTIFGLFIMMLALLPNIGIAFLWWRSYRQTDDIFAYDPGRMTRFRTSGGGFWYETRPWPNNTASNIDWQIYKDRTRYPFAASPDDPWYQRLGVLWDTKNYDLLLAAPYWMALLLSLPLPLWLLLRRCRREKPRTQTLIRHVSEAGPVTSIDIPQRPQELS